MGEICIPNAWEPRDHQMDLWDALEGGVKRACVVWHRRAGKDSTALNWAASSMLDRVGTYWHMAPTHRQVRKIVWDGIDKAGRRMINQAFPKELRARTNDQEMKIELVNGSIWQCVGSDNYDSLVGANPVGVVFSEWSLANPAAWDYIRPILLENGGWAIFIYTPRGKNHGHSLLEMAKQSPGWFWQVLSIEDTKLIPLADIEAERRELALQYSPEEADSIIGQEWHVDFNAPVLGAYYSRQLTRLEREGHIGQVDFDPTLPVYTSWDLGIGDSTAIWFFQIHGNEIAVIDFLEHAGVGLSWYVNRLIGYRKYNDDGTERPRHEWAFEQPEDEELHAHRRAYVYAPEGFSAYVPHDAHNSELGTGKRRVDILQGMGVRCYVLPRMSVEDGIAAVRATLPRLYFDERRCERGLGALHSYRKEWDDKLQQFKDKPLHDWASNPADSLRYLCLGLRKRPPEPLTKPLPAPFTEAWQKAYDAEDARDEEQQARYYR